MNEKHFGLNRLGLSSIPIAELILCAGFISLWLIPFKRLGSFLPNVKQVFAEEGTINAYNDLHYAYLLLLSYSLCSGITIGMIFLLKRGRNWLLLLLPLLAVLGVIYFQPEEVIVLFPTMNPLIPLCLVCIPAPFALVSYLQSGKQYRTT